MTQSDRLPAIPHDWVLSEEPWKRFHHADIPELTTERIWGERVWITNELADRLSRRVRDGLLSVRDGAPIPESHWLRARIVALDGELRRRGGQ